MNVYIVIQNLWESGMIIIDVYATREDAELACHGKTYPNSEQYDIVEKEMIGSIENDYNPTYGDTRLCTCGHEYYRHFDTYCECRIFNPAL